MNIAGVLIHGAAPSAQRLADDIARIPGTEVHALTPEGRLVVTIERDREDDLACALNQMIGLDGVLASALVYHYCDSNDISEGCDVSDTTRVHQE